MRIGIPRESAPETLVAATPKTVAALIKLGHRVEVEMGAGTAASFPDDAYLQAGADSVETDRVWTADFIGKIAAPTADEIGRLHRRPATNGGFIACLLAPARSPELLHSLAETGVTALAMDAVPRISRAQSLDVLSSMANLSGYRAVIEAAHAFGGLFTGQVTAAGKMPPARVFVVGAGVAGLAAIGAANSLGAVVRAFDVRPEVAEQVESMGAQFVALAVTATAAGNTPQRTDGYASELTGDTEAAARVMYDAEARAADIVITTALIPGRPAPTLITADTVAAMKPGSVLVDLAAANGGNVEGTRTGERVVTSGGVTILGYTDLAGRLPTQASQLYGTNMVNLVKLLTPDTETGELLLDSGDQVLRGMTVTRAGEVSWPPPPVAVAAQPAAPVETPSAARASTKDPRRRTLTLALIAVLFALAATFSPPAFLGHLTVFALAVVVGYYVISHVTHALHTPLMSVTNAISGIIGVGALLQVGSTNTAITVLSLAGIVVASVNIFGGFTVTQRMLGMFRRD
ncbi:MAG: Re/Si-specific NAD(P)(+) transhydrogenase subunit alpha [Actinomycetota bacterium]|nr:Re/Si-specific NAD(P)(+) transhydrogenase subunit alpha [Actinomycetota bacterium]